MSEKISREDIDDYYQRNVKKDSCKNRLFDGKWTTLDEYTGETLYYSAKGINATSDQGSHFSTAKIANVDHIVPIDQLIEKHGNSINKDQ